MSFKKAVIVLLTLMFIPYVTPAKVVKNTAYYKVHAQRLINQAVDLGPRKGYMKLTITNPHRNSYPSYAPTILTSGNPQSAKTHAAKIKDPASRKQQLLKVKNQAKAMGL